MTELEAHLGAVQVGTVYRHASASGERISFRYADEWLTYDGCFAIDPELFLDTRTTSPSRGGLFGALTDRSRPCRTRHHHV